MRTGSAASDRANLRGRAEECARLKELVSDVRRGVSRSLVLCGEAGIGKTALLEYLIASAPDLTILRTFGVQSEMELAYSGLHQLCAPLLEHLERLPPPQRQALEIVFGLSGGPPPSRFLVGLGVLNLLSDAAQERPMLCVVDDAQWLDQATATALPFVARRLLAEPIGIVFATRGSYDEIQHVPELELHGLVNGDARALLQSVVQFSIDERVRERIVAETRGNPLALLELPRGLSATELAGGFGLPGTHALTGRIEQSFVRRLEALPDQTRSLLLVAAAEPIGDTLLLWRAAAQLGIGPRALDAAEHEGLVAVGERVIFRHPLVRSAIYGSATIEDRRAVHVALAEATDRDADPDRWAWHLAAAAAGPDEHVAAELERSAGRAQSRGGVAAAAAFLQRAVVLTQDASRRAERALSAAQTSLQAGALDKALRLVAIAEAEPLDEFQRARVELLRGHVGFASGSEEAPSLLLEAATRLEPFDVAVARETYLNAWGAAGLTSHRDRGARLMAVSRAIRSLPPPIGDSGALDLLLAGLGLLSVDGYSAAVPTFRRAATALAHIPVEDVLRWGWASATASMAIWDDDGMRAVSVRQVHLVREAGELAQLPIHLSVLAYSLASTGDFPGAAAVLAELDNVIAATGSQIAPYSLLKLRALQGRQAEASAAIASAGEQGFTHAYLAAAVLNNGLGRYKDAAYAAGQAAAATFEPWAATWALPELVEAAARIGDSKLACDALDRVVTATHVAGTDWALGLEARCRALVTEGADADELYRAAIERLGRTAVRTELARAHLLYGEWLRRERRRVDARAQLRLAYDRFASIGMEAFAERARRELAATGETVRKPTVETRDELTAQERQVALLARDGMSNSEIGARLFLSQHTAAYHLRKVFSKLGITSRRELAAALPSSGSELTPA